MRQGTCLKQTKLMQKNLGNEKKLLKHKKHKRKRIRKEQTIQTTTKTTTIKRKVL